MMAFIIGLIAMIIMATIGTCYSFIVDKLGIEMIIQVVMVCIMSYILGNLILGVF